MADNKTAAESWFIKIGVLYDKSGFKSAVGGLLDVRRAASNLYESFRKVVDVNSDLYNTARYLNMSTGDLQIWERAFRLIGGSADEARSAISNLNFVYDKLRLGMDSEKASIGARLQLTPDDFLTFETMMEALNRSFNTYFKGDYGAFKVLADQLGLSETAMLLVTQSTEEFNRTLKRATDTPLIPERHLKAARELDSMMTNLSIKWETFKASLLSAAFPSLERLFGHFERLISDPETTDTIVRLFENLEHGIDNLTSDNNLSTLVKNLSELANAVVTLAKFGGTLLDFGLFVPKYYADKLGTFHGWLTSDDYSETRYKVPTMTPYDKATPYKINNPLSNVWGRISPANLVQNININGAQNPKDIAMTVADYADSALNGNANMRTIENREMSAAY